MDIQTVKRLVLPVLKKHGVVRAAIFGSAARGKATEKSDIDFLVELPPTVHGFDYVALKVGLAEDLKGTLKKDVDVVEYKLVKQSLKPYILPTQVQIL